MKTIPLREVAHARAGDKTDTSNVGVIAYDRADYELLREQVTAERVKAHYGDLVLGAVTRYEVPNIGALNFVMKQALTVRMAVQRGGAVGAARSGVAKIVAEKVGA